MVHSNVVKYFLTVASLLVSAKAFTQVGFLSTLGVASDEPNSAVQLIEVDGEYIISGQYFDQRVGRWTTGYTFFDTDGHYIKHLMELHDTVPITTPTNTMLADDKGLYKLSLSTANKTKLVEPTVTEKDLRW